MNVTAALLLGEECRRRDADGGMRGLPKVVPLAERVLLDLLVVSLAHGVLLPNHRVMHDSRFE